MYIKKLHFEAKKHLLFSDLRYDQYPSRRGRKRSKNAHFWHVVARHAMRIGRMVNWRTGGDFTHDFAEILYTSICSVINSWKSNQQHNFGFFWRKNVLNNTKTRSQLSIWIFMPHRSDVYEKVAFRGEESPPFLRFAIRPIPVGSREKTYEKSRHFVRFRLRRDWYWSYRKSETRRWFVASKCIFFVYITSVWHKYPYT